MIQAQKDWVIVENTKQEKKTASGIIYETNIDRRDAYVLTARVVSSGCEDIVDGEEVMLNYYDASPYETPEGDRYLSVQGKMVMAKVIPN
jgi:co-chaperonin GroES (HSP10)